MHTATDLAEQLSVLRRWADAVLVHLDQGPESTDANVVKLHADLSRLARQTSEKATTPITIAVVGEVGSGKTLLLGSLIGFADGLPVAETPCTGNVTALLLSPSEDVQVADPHSFTIHYLAGAEIQACLAHMLEAARARAAAALPADVQQALHRFDAGDPAVWNALLQWCERAWDHRPKNPSLLWMLREMVSFARASVQCGAAAAGQTRVVGNNVARQGLQRGDPPADIAALSFRQLPAAGSPLSTLPTDLTPELLRATFPLIRRVDVQVKLPNGIWDLSDLSQTNPFVLLDFPGLGAADSGMRDEFLCNLELSEAQTILVLLNAQRPGSGQARQIFNHLQGQQPNLKDRVLVGVGRFDQLPLENEGGVQILEELAGGDPNAEGDDPFAQASRSSAVGLNAGEVEQRLHALRQVISDAEAIIASGKEKILFLSPLLALDELARSRPGLPVGTPSFMANLSRLRPTAAPVLAVWRRLTEALKTSDPTAPLTRWLMHFCRDGGAGRLRDLLLDHVAQHGLLPLAQDARRLAEQLRDQLRLYVAASNREAVRPVGASDRLRTAVTRISRVYDRQRKNWLAAAPELVLEGGQRTVSDAVRGHLVYHLFHLEGWQRIFSRLRDGRVVLRQEENSAAEEEMDPELAALMGTREKDAGDTPTSSDELYEAFALALKDSALYGRQQVREAVPGLLRRLSASEPVVEAQQELLAALGFPGSLPAVEQRVRTSAGEDGMRKLGALKVALEPERFLVNTIALRCRIRDADPLNVEVDPYFPFPRGDRRFPRGRLFPWAAEMPAKDRETPDHFVQAFRLRNELATCACQAIGREVSALERLVVQTVCSFIEKDLCENNLERIAADERFLRIVTGEAHSASANAGAASALANLEFPF